MSSEELLKAREIAIKKALDFIRDDMVIGYGTGTTMAQAIRYIKEKIDREDLEILFVPTSFQSRQLLLENNLKIVSLYEYPELDLTIDSFDQCDLSGNVIKGGGGAMLIEKVVAQASRKVVFVGDYTKLVEILNRPVPIEILIEAYPHVYRKISQMKFKLELRQSTGKIGPVISENGNLIGDVEIGLIHNPEEIDRKLRSIAGVIETGIFPKLADKIIIGKPDGSLKEIDVR
ncbi:MAG: ribose 5-phosphate isomerase A [Nitrososphaerota archaeon]